MAKVLKTKKINLYIYWLNCNFKPSDYISAEEMKSIINEVRPALAEQVAELVNSSKEIAEIQRDFSIDKITEKKAIERVAELTKKSRKLEIVTGDDIVTVEFDKDDFSHMFDLFSRVGKDWYNNTETYMEFDRDLNDANKDKEKNSKS